MRASWFPGNSEHEKWIYLTNNGAEERGTAGGGGKRRCQAHTALRKKTLNPTSQFHKKKQRLFANEVNHAPP